jgi:hypothetical protein
MPDDLRQIRDRLRVLLERATPGRWRRDHPGSWEAINDRASSTIYTGIVGARSSVVCMTVAGPHTDRADQLFEANTDLILAMHTALPMLLDRVDEADRLREALEAADDIRKGYVEFLHHMPSSDLEQHPYIPLVEEAFDKVRSARCLASTTLPAASARADDGWRPIATWEGQPNGEAHPVILCVDEGPERAPSVGEAYYDPDAYDGTWWWAGTRFGNWGDSPLCDTQLGQPTHWRPLPTPPATDPIR